MSSTLCFDDGARKSYPPHRISNECVMCQLNDKLEITDIQWLLWTFRAHSSSHKIYYRSEMFSYLLELRWLLLAAWARMYSLKATEYEFHWWLRSTGSAAVTGLQDEASASSIALVTSHHGINLQSHFQTGENIITIHKFKSKDIKSLIGQLVERC